MSLSNNFNERGSKHPAVNGSFIAVQLNADSL